jgi:hypothetical protein
MGLTSIPTLRAPIKLAAVVVVPDPTNGSMTADPRSAPKCLSAARANCSEKLVYV